MVSEQRCARAARDDRLELVAVEHPAGELEDVGQRRAERRPRSSPGLIHVAGDRNILVPGDFSVPHCLNQSAPLLTMRGSVDRRLGVVDHGRLAVETLDRGERGPKPRLPPVALERIQQRGLLAADVRAGTSVQDDVEVELRAEDPRAEDNPCS